MTWAQVCRSWIRSTASRCIWRSRCGLPNKHDGPFEGLLQVATPPTVGDAGLAVDDLDQPPDTDDTIGILPNSWAM